MMHIVHECRRDIVAYADDFCRCNLLVLFIYAAFLIFFYAVASAQIYYDKIIIFTVIDLTFDRSAEGDLFFRSYKETLKERFQQEEVLITAQILEII